jgi:hypothetical protein
LKKFGYVHLDTIFVPLYFSGTMKYLHSIAITIVVGLVGAVAIGQVPEPQVEEAAPAIRAKEATDDLPQFILLNTGRILEGVITRNPEGGLLVRQKLGLIKVSSADIEGIFPNLTAVYEHKKEILPPRDIQERMRLYRWALSVGLLKQAQEQLKAILALSPDHEEAQILLAQLDTRISRKNATMADPGVVQTSATSTKDGGANEIDPIFLNRALRDMALRTSPVIFDLPEPQALKRAQEFNQYIHPVVQKYCASCHNERTPQGYPLVSANGRASRDQAILRANLDATLGLVNASNLMQSPLLTNSLLPHHPNNQPIFSGPNNPYYRLLANWVSNLQSRGVSAVKPVSRTESESPFGAESPGDAVNMPAAKSAGGFAQEGRISEPGSEEAAGLPIPLNPKVMQQSRLQEVPPDQPVAASPGRMIPGSYNGPATEAPKGTRFTKPLSAGANPEELLRQLQAEEAERDAREKEREEALSKLNDQNRRTSGEATKAEGKSKDAPAKSAKKPVKIDEKLMERFLFQRSSGN